MRISFRLNAEYDQELINRVKSYSNRNLSKTLRKIIREHLQYATLSNELSAPLSDTKNKEKQETKKEIPKWNFPK